MHIYNYEFLKTDIPADVAGLSNIIYDFKGQNEIRKGSSPKTFEALRTAAMIDSISASNAIEGIVTTKKRMAKISDSSFIPSTKSETELVGYRDALTQILSGNISGPVNTALVRHIHRVMLGQAVPDAGEFKREDNWIQERDAQGRISIRFVPVGHRETPSAVEQWALAYESARQDYGISRLYLICCAIVDFLCIHPFTDGNGRVSRLLTTYLLEREGFDIGRFISVDKKINEYKYNYYEALRRSSEGWHENRQDYTPFMVFMMQILYSCYKDLDLRFYESSQKHVPKSKQIEAIMMNAVVPVSKADILSRIPEASVSTVEKVLGNLIKEGKIQKIGSYKDARYKRRD